MRVSLVQTELYWADKTKNFQHFEEILSALAGQTDLVVLPEMFTTGFCVNRLDLAETVEGETVAKLKDWSSDYNFAITGSFIALENEKIFNRSFFVKPDGTIRFADKHHLFAVGGEDKIFSPGEFPLQVNYLGFNIQVLICYEVRFPEWSFNRNNAYDLLIYVANFPKKRISDWDKLLKARAIENQSYTIGLNRVGTDGVGIEYNGHSVLLDFKSKVMADFEDSESSVKTVELELEPLQKFRERFFIQK